MRNQQEEPTRGTNGRAQENQLKLIQARKTLKARDRVLMAAIRRCHTELAKRISFRDIEASKDAVEAAWKEFQHASSRYCMYAGEDRRWIRSGEDPFGGNAFEEQPEEVRRAWYEWKAFLNMMEQVVEKAEEYLEQSDTKENSCDELCKDEDGGKELDAKVKQLPTMNKDDYVAISTAKENHYIHPLANPNFDRSSAITLKRGPYVHPFAELEVQNFEKVEVSAMDEDNWRTFPRVWKGVMC